VIEFITENASTIIVGAIVAAAVILDIIYLVHSEKNGKSSCGCDCGECGKKCKCKK